jgi:tetratricopeptide (TPR) repeat protein
LLFSESSNHKPFNDLLLPAEIFVEELLEELLRCIASKLMLFYLQRKVYRYVTTIADIRGKEESKLKLALTILIFLLIAGFTQAHETVCPSGCDSASIQAAVYAAHPNDTIDLYSGTYNESVVLTKNIIFRGINTGNGVPIVNGDIYQNGFNMVLRGFSFRSIFLDLSDAENMTTPNTTFYRIEKAFENPSKSKAIAGLDEIIKANPKDAWALFRKGWALSDTGRYEDSIDILNEAIKLDPYFASPWNLIGDDFCKLFKYDKALDAYEKAIQLRPGIGLYWSSKGARSN